jgi:pSer/pThr/pTyr-binding forkhead associated (FHA) protein
MAIKLVIKDTSTVTPSVNHELDQSLITFGRSKSCHVELDHPNVSRRHFLIKFIDHEYILMDEGSRHGTILDGQKLEPRVGYPLAHGHLIEVPGFLVSLVSDGKKPKMERTLVVARQLLDELLQDDAKPRACPTLQSKDGQYRFSFVEEKASFVLGTWPEVDFVVASESVYKKHLSFARDINGIRLIPLPGHQVLYNNQAVAEPLILNHGSIIKVGDIELCFKEHDHQEIILTDEEPHPEPTLPLPKIEVQAPPQPKKHPDLRAVDRLFLIAFVLVLAGTSVLLFEMI